MAVFLLAGMDASFVMNPHPKTHPLPRAITWLNTTIGRLAAWLCLAVVLIGAWNAIARYLTKYTGLHLSSNAYLELQWYLFSAIFLLGAAYTLARDEHVRVDILYARFSPRVQAWINLLGASLFLLPFSLYLIWASWYPVAASWAIREQSPDPGGLARYPIKTLMLIAFVLLFLQGIVQWLQAIHHLRHRHEPSPSPEGHSS
ncbi:MAG TPA: TRAP transporter small permease subunit [Kiritimatiellia bacterium]|nr:TRAP transporter small permease subunit [Kiritimatiellia bacterium]